ncbi:MAG: 4-hydroxy-tetrahydrodipicolinate synthase [Candidatus Onthomonas sp.]|nr:4-hydroxy-tetrahydrodipicolinate synthase [Candidatus Onthomonas sp.]
MKTPIFTGACVAIVTPYTENGINFDKLGELIERQIAGGTDAICICGTTGEASTQTIEEHKAAIEYCVKKVDHRVKVIAGTGSNCTMTALDLSLYAESCGADGLLIVTPYYNKATQTGLIKHYTYIADRVHTPIIMYNVPSRTGTKFTAETYYELSKHPMINGIKEASGDFSLAIHTLQLCGDNINIWSGNDDQVVPLMSLGAKGVISVASNVKPELMVEMSHLCLEGKFAEAAQLQVSTIELMDALFVEVNPIPVKVALNMMGLEVGNLRMPLCDMSAAHKEVLSKALMNAGLEVKNPNASA